MPTEDNSERRQGFRIDDELYLEIVTEEEHAHGEEWRICHELQTLRELSHQSGHILAAIRKREPEMGSYLELLERQIESLARMVGEQSLGKRFRPNQRASLSASGIGFSSETGFSVGDSLRLRLILFPDYLEIKSSAEVRHVKPHHSEPSRYWIGCQFNNLPRRTEEILIRHLLERQSEAIRDRRDQAGTQAEQRQIPPVS